MDLGFLAIPLFTALGAFSLAVFTNVEAVNIESISVPSSVASKTGFTSDVVVTRLADRMQQIEHQAQTRADAKEVMAHDEGGTAAVLGEFFELTPLLRAVQTTFGLIPYTFSGEIVASGDNLEMVLRGRDNHEHETTIREGVEGRDVPKLIDKVAYEAVRMIDPYLLAAYQFKKDYMVRDFTTTETVIRRALAAPEARDQKWMLNLWGVVLYQEADREGAIDKFRQALDLDPTFASAMFNWGVVLAREGKLEDAIDKFQAVVLGWKRGDPSDTLAAAYTEWGFSLALLGHADRAYAKFQKASEADPELSDVYTSWAEVLSAQGNPEEAQKMTARAVELAPVEKVYTENLVGRIQSLPAVAASH